MAAPAAEPVQWQGTSYTSLADGKYDVIILGTGLKECILSGLLSVKGKKVRPSRRRRLAALRGSRLACWHRHAPL